ncbi:MAG: PAS domain S-box protein [Fuerstiella sp.]
MASFIDISDRKQAEQALRESEEQLRLSLRAAGQGLYDLDLTTGDAKVSPEYATMIGHDPATFEESNAKWAERLHPDDREKVYSTFDAYVRGEVSGYDVEFRQRTSTGGWLWTLSIGSIVAHDADGKPLRMLGTHTDISRRKLAEEALRDSEARYRRAERGTNDGLWEWDIASGEHYFSIRWLELLGYLPDELPNRLETFTERVHPNDFSAAWEAAERHLQSRQPYDMELRLRHKRGDYLWVRSRGQAEWDAAGKPVRMTGSITDITERRRTEQALRESEYRLDQAIRVAQIGIFDHDHRTDEIYWSREQQIINGWCEENQRVALADYINLVHPGDRERIAEAVRLAHDPKGDGLFDIEHRIIRPDGSLRWLDTRSQTYFEGEGTARQPIRTVGAVLDVTERKQAEDAVGRARDEAERALADLSVASARAEQFYRLCEAAGQDIGISRLDGTLTYMNPAFRTLLEFPDGDDVTRRAFWELVPSENHQFLAESVLTQTRETGTWSGEFDLLTLTGKRVPIINTVVLLRDPDGTVFGYSNIATDITEQKRSEQALRESEERFRAYIEYAPTGLVVLDENGRYVDVNPASCRISGYDREELLRMGVGDLTTPEAKAESRPSFDRIKQDGAIEVDWLLRQKSGELRQISIAAVRLTGNRSMGFITDITERKRAEQALRESELRYRTLIETSSDAIFLMDLTGRIRAANPAAVKMHGYSKEELFSMRMQELDVPDDAANLPDRMRRLRAGESLTFEVAHRRKDGTTFPLEVIASAVEIGGEWLVMGFNRDITERKRAEDAIRESEARLRIALSAATAVAFVWDAATGSVSRYFSTEPALPMNLHAPESVAAVRARVHPDDREQFDAGIAACLADGSDYRNLYRVVRPDGTTRWLEEWGTLESDPAGLPVCLTGISIDVTERKAAEQALVEEKSLLQAMFGSLPGIAFAFDQSGRYVRWNHNYDTLLGWSDEEMTHHTALDTIVPRDRERIAAVIRDVFVLGENSTELHALRKDGGELPLFCTGVRVSLGGEPCVVGFGIDISDRLEAEAALRASEERLRIFIENAPVGVAMFDRDMKYISHSRRWLTDYGLGDQNLIGRSHYEVFPEVTDQWKEIHQRCLTGASERCEQDRFERADGTVDYLRWEIQPWTNVTGTVGGLVFLTEMITDRVRAEEQIRLSLREKEAMLKEIHHRVKNNLQVISSLLSLQAAQLTTHPAAADVLAESQNRVRAMALVHETLYRSDDLARVDLSRYIGELCGFLFRSFGVDSARVSLVIDVESVTVSLEKTIPCGLLMNEIVSNSLKYAFPGTRSGTVSIRARMQPDGRLSLTLADDGVGLPADLVIDSTPTLGLQLVNILADQLGGQLTLNRFGGTRFDLSFAP